MDSDILVLIIAVAASLVSVVAKSKKKSEQAKHPTSLPGESPWSMFGSEEEQESEAKGTHRVLTPPSDRYASLETLVSLEDTPRRIAIHDNPRFTNVNNITDVTSNISIDESGERVGSPTSNSKGALDEFDLRQAVIYSEILNAKYKQY